MTTICTLQMRKYLQFCLGECGLNLISSELTYDVHFKSHIDLISDPEQGLKFAGIIQTSLATV